jgi:hypothetical protein
MGNLTPNPKNRREYIVKASDFEKTKALMAKKLVEFVKL